MQQRNMNWKSTYENLLYLILMKSKNKTKRSLQLSDMETNSSYHSRRLFLFGNVSIRGNIIYFQIIC